MKKLAILTLGLLLATAWAGCKTTGRTPLVGPGDERTQVQRAQRYDPYPDNAMGPALTGVRPPAYDKPRSETTQARSFLDNHSSANQQNP